MHLFLIVMVLFGLASELLAVEFTDWNNPQAVYEYRAELMQNNKTQMQAMLQALRANDFDTLELGAEDILFSYAILPELFSPGSGNFPDSESRPEIWAQPERFAATVAEAQRAAEDFTAAVAKKDSRLVSLQYRELGQSCRSCHTNFRK